MSRRSASAPLESWAPSPASAPRGGGAVSELESEVLTCYLDGRPYEEIAERLACDTKTVDNALQRVKRKVGNHLDARELLH
jgi:DNA-binding CsgD family transcriptional regulator